MGFTPATGTEISMGCVYEAFGLTPFPGANIGLNSTLGVNRQPPQALGVSAIPVSGETELSVDMGGLTTQDEYCGTPLTDCYVYEYINTTSNTFSFGPYALCPGPGFFDIQIPPFGEGTTFCIVQLPESTVNAYNLAGLTLTEGATLCYTPFVTTWQTANTSLGSSNSNQIKLPLHPTGNYNFTVNWGDGNNNTITIWNQAEVTHTYSSPGEYTVTIIGTCSEFSFENLGDKEKLLTVASWGNVNLGNVWGVFWGCVNLDLSTVADVPNLSAMNTLKSMFAECTSLTTINNINSWDVSTITDMSDMFNFATLFNQNLSSWDVSNVTTMEYMFESSSSFNSDITGWNVSNVSNMRGMFGNAPLFNQNIGSWNVSSVTNMSYMFSKAHAFNQNIGGWNVINVTDMSFMFAEAINFNQPIGSWNVSNVTNMEHMFGDTLEAITSGATNFNQNISGWNVSNVTSMERMFRDATNFNQNIGGWNVSSVTNMSQMFLLAINFNQNIGGWNVANVTDMSSMFQEAYAFNQNIGSWNISNVINFNGFMVGKNTTDFSSTNLNAIYNGWSSRPVQPNITISFWNIEYTSAGQSGRNILTGSPNNWSIQDGGMI